MMLCYAIINYHFAFTGLLTMKNVLIALGKACCYTLLFIILQYAASFAYALVAGAIAAVKQLSSSGSIDYGTIVGTLYDTVTSGTTIIVLISNICTILALVVFFALRKKNLLDEVGATPIPGATYLPLSIAGMSLAVLVIIILNMLPISEEAFAEYTESTSVIDSSGFISMVSTVIFAPIAEEMIFRGLVYTRLKRAMPKWIAAVLQAALFGVLHGQILWIAYAFAVGLILAAYFESTGSLFANITVHICFNLMGGYILSYIFTESTAVYIVFASVVLLTVCTRSAIRIAKSGKNI